MSGQRWRVWMAFGLVAASIGGVPAPRPAVAATTRVVVSGMRFAPPRVEIAMGDSVIWEAADEGHTVTARDGSFDSSPRGLMAEGDQYRFRFRLPGTFAYFCRVHQTRGMQGEIVVVDPAAPTTTSTRLTPVSAAAPTSSTATTATTAPTTTTSRPLATSSTTSMSVATATTAPLGAPVVPQEPPTLNPNARIVGTPASGADLSEEQAAARRSDGSGAGPGPAVLSLLAALGIAGGALALRKSRRS
jgi:plastocyanin